MGNGVQYRGFFLAHFFILRPFSSGSPPHVLIVVYQVLESVRAKVR